MKKLVNRAVVLLAVFAIASVLTLAKMPSKQVTFGKPVTVNGTIIKAGTYKVTFDEQTGEMTIAKGKKVVAKVPARLEKLEEDSHAAYTTRVDSNVLLSVTLKDGNRAVIENAGNNVGERKP